MIPKNIAVENNSKSSYLPSTAPVGFRLTRNSGGNSTERPTVTNKDQFNNNQNVYVSDKNERIDENQEFIIQNSGDTPNSFEQSFNRFGN